MNLNKEPNTQKEEKPGELRIPVPKFWPSTEVFSRTEEASSIETVFENQIRQNKVTRVRNRGNPKINNFCQQPESNHNIRVISTVSSEIEQDASLP